MQNRRQSMKGTTVTSVTQMVAHNHRKATETRRCESSIDASQTKAMPTWSGRRIKPWRRKAR